MKRTDPPAAAPIAHSFVYSFCGECPNAHVLFFAPDRTPLCQATISLRQLIDMATAVAARDPNFSDPTIHHP